MSGATESTCPLPCTRTTPNTIATNTENDGAEISLQIIFDQSIMITNVTLDKFQPMASLNILGSNLGLWPGLGIFQLFEWFFDNILCRIRIQDIGGQLKAKMTKKIFNAGN